MAQQLSPKVRRALAGEIATWQDESLISKDLAEVLLARYPAKGSQGMVITVMTILGAVLVGLGAILFIGANWHQLGPIWKLALIFAIIIAAHAAGWFFRFEPGNRPKLGSALLLLGSLLYGAGIWLVAQIFNLDSNPSDGLFLWTIGTMLSACVTRVAAVGILANILGTVWLSNYTANWSAPGGDPIAFAGMTLLTGSVAYLVASPWAMGFGLFNSTFWVLVYSSTSIYGLLAWGAALFCGYLWHRKHWQLFAKPFMYVGTASALIALLTLTYSCVHLFDKSVLLDRLLMLLGIMALSIVAACRGEKETPPEVQGTFLITMAALAIACIPNDLARTLLSNINVVAAMLLLVFAGLRRLHSVALVNLTVVFFVFFIIARYFDMFFSMLDRSVFFIAGGIVLLVAGSLAEKSRRKLLEGLQT